MKGSYKQLAWMGILHVPIMYFLMFTMVYSFEDFFMNINMVYMAITMAAPMVIVMPIMMASMYKDQRMNFVVYGIAAILLVVFLAFIRNQTLIGDKSFLRSMIPHHSGAILMCERAKLDDAEIKILCEQIIQSQRNEIEQMRKILDRK